MKHLKLFEDFDSGGGYDYDSLMPELIEESKKIKICSPDDIDECFTILNVKGEMDTFTSNIVITLSNGEKVNIDASFSNSMSDEHVRFSKGKELYKLDPTQYLEFIEMHDGIISNFYILQKLFYPSYFYKVDEDIHSYEFDYAMVLNWIDSAKVRKANAETGILDEKVDSLFDIGIFDSEFDVTGDCAPEEKYLNRAKISDKVFVISAVGDVDDDFTKLTIELSDTSVIKFDCKFFNGDPRFRDDINEQHVKISREFDGKIETVEINPNYYLDYILEKLGGNEVYVKLIQYFWYETPYDLHLDLSQFTAPK